MENNCGVWSYDRREKPLSANLNSHLASAVLALIGEFDTNFICGCSFFYWICNEVAVVVIIFAMIDHATKQKHIDAMNAI